MNGNRSNHCLSHVHYTHSLHALSCKTQTIAEHSNGTCKLAKFSISWNNRWPGFSRTKINILRFWVTSTKHKHKSIDTHANIYIALRSHKFSHPTYGMCSKTSKKKFFCSFLLLSFDDDVNPFWLRTLFLTNSKCYAIPRLCVSFCVRMSVRCSIREQ